MANPKIVPLESSRTAIRRVLVPVILSIPVESEDDEQAEFLAVEAARNAKLEGPHGEIRVSSLLLPLCEQPAPVDTPKVPR